MEYSPCSNQADCRLADSKMGCREDVHHIFWPRKDYSHGIARPFRELPENKVRLCRAEHDELHQQPAPEKPPIAEMQAALYGAIGKQALDSAS